MADSSAAAHREANRAHWSATLDARNLTGEGPAIPLQQQLALAETADVVAAMDHLEPLAGRKTLDLGGGLGLMAMLLARRGARVVVADLSAERLALARRQAASADQTGAAVAFVCCAAEELPFRDGAFQRQITKSVLIHTDLPGAASELHRTLAPRGRAAFIEPTTGNPFVNAYRRLAAPAIWASITRYFSADRFAVLEQPFRAAGRPVSRRAMFFLGFFATPLNFMLPSVRGYRLAESALLAADDALFAIVPALHRAAWFCIVMIGQTSNRR